MGKHFFCQVRHGGIRFPGLGVLMVRVVRAPVHPDVLFSVFRCVTAVHLKLFIQVIAHGLGHPYHLVDGIFLYFPGPVVTRTTGLS